VSARHRVTLVAGDGVGPEVADATVHVLEAAAAPIEWEEVVAGERALVTYGTALPGAALDSIRRNGVALKARLRGAPGSANPNVALRRELGLGTQLRPVKSLPGSRYPALDLVVIRETT
jgi:isocitrate dehydrogenase (NAD+)